METIGESLRQHWPEYLMEAAGLGMFLVSAGFFATLLESPGSPIRAEIPQAVVRRALMGLAVGLTAVTIIYSPWGQQSGAHLNPAVTVTFLRMRKIKVWDAVFYSAAQCIGGITGVSLVYFVLREAFGDSPVSFLVTAPGEAGVGVAFAAEFAMCFGLMLMVLVTTNDTRWRRYTGWFAGLLLFLYITVEAPLSGMSINPARSLASASLAGTWTAFWVYILAPVLGMLAASQVYLATKGKAAVKCCKLNHLTDKRCIHCGVPGGSVQAGKPRVETSDPEDPIEDGRGGRES